MLTVLITILHVIVCLVLIAVVLLQTGKRADLAGAFGGGGSQTAFGTRGAATFLSKATTGFAIMFMLTSIALSVLSARGSVVSSRSVLDEVQTPATTEAPAEPTTPAGESTPLESSPATDDAGTEDSAPAQDATQPPAEEDSDS